LPLVSLELTPGYTFSGTHTSLDQGQDLSPALAQLLPSLLSLLHWHHPLNGHTETQIWGLIRLRIRLKTENKPFFSSWRRPVPRGSRSPPSTAGAGKRRGGPCPAVRGLSDGAAMLLPGPGCAAPAPTVGHLTC